MAKQVALESVRSAHYDCLGLPAGEAGMEFGLSISRLIHLHSANYKSDSFNFLDLFFRPSTFILTPQVIGKKLVETVGKVYGHVFVHVDTVFSENLVGEVFTGFPPVFKIR